MNIARREQDLREQESQDRRISPVFFILLAEWFQKARMSSRYCGFSFRLGLAAQQFPRDSFSFTRAAE